MPRLTNQFISKLLTLLCVVFLPLKESFGEESLRIGLAVPLTGMAAEYGHAYLNGLKLALDDANKSLLPVKLIIEDHRYEATQTLAAAKKLVSVDRVNVLNVWGFMPSDTVAPLADRLDTLLILQSANPASKNRPHTLNSAVPAHEMNAPLLAYAKKHGYKKVAVVSASLGALEAQGAEMEQQFKRNGITVLSSRIPGDMADFRPLLTRLKFQTPQAAALFIGPQQAALLLRQARELHIDFPFFGADTINDPEVNVLFAGSDHGPIFSDYSITDHFIARYRRAYGTASRMSEAGHGYTVGLLLNFLRTRPPFDTANLFAALRAMPPGSGPGGAYRLTNDADFGLYLHSEYALFEIVRGAPTMLQLRGRRWGA